MFTVFTRSTRMCSTLVRCLDVVYYYVVIILITWPTANSEFQTTPCAGRGINN